MVRLIVRLIALHLAIAAVAFGAVAVYQGVPIVNAVVVANLLMIPAMALLIFGDFIKR